MLVKIKGTHKKEMESGKGIEGGKRKKEKRTDTHIQGREQG